MSQRFEFEYDEQLRDIPKDPARLRAHVDHLTAELPDCEDPSQQVTLLGEIGTYQRSLRLLDDAEEALRTALAIVHEHRLGVSVEIQQSIRLANVLQWKCDFAASNRLFEDVLAMSRREGAFLDFALQHAGKNLFDQLRFTEALAMFEEALILRRERSAPMDQIVSTELAILRTRAQLG